MARVLDRLLDTLYASILDEPPWLAFLEAMEHHVPCHHCTMVLRKPREGDVGMLIASPANNAALAALQQHHFRDSPFLELPEGKVCTLAESELKTRHPEYYRYIRHYSKATDLIGVDLQEPCTGMTFRLRGARIDGEPSFGERERKLFEALIPRLRTAIALYARIALQQYQLSVLDETAGQLAIGSMVLDDSGRVLVKNTVADRLLLDRDGFHLRDGIVHCNDAKEERNLRVLLARFRSDAPATAKEQTIKVRRGNGERFWSVLARPSRARPGLEEKASATVVVLVRDASHTPDVSDAALIELFGLTRAEAALAVRLVKGESLNDAAVSLGISRYTARAQLASVFARTGMHRQSQLVSHVLGTLNTVWG
jgi:DNA-binding CsgD family transcriptional regulator